MGFMSLDDVVAEIEKKAKVGKQNIHKRVDEIHSNYSGLITKEGAALILAKEMGVEIAGRENKKLQMKNIVPGMRNVNVVGRIFKISPSREFERKDGTKGRVVNVFVADSTGHVRVPLWDDQVDLVSNEILKIGDVVQISSGFAKENMYGDIEVSLGKFGAMKPVDGDGFVDLTNISRKYISEDRRTNVSDLVPGNFEVKAMVTQVFKGKFVFESEVGEKFLVVSCMIEDETGSIRSVFFRDVAEKAMGISLREIEQFDLDQRFEKVSQKLIGKELIVSGKVQKNKMFERLEVVANTIKPLNTIDESKRLLDELEQRLV